MPLQMFVTDPAKVLVSMEAPAISGGVVISKDDPLVRKLGGRREAGTGYPSEQFTYGKAITYNTDHISSIEEEFEFIPSVSSFDFYTIDNSNSPILVLINGTATNSTGYTVGSGSTGALQYFHVDLPASAIGQRIRLSMGGQGYGGLVLATGGTLADPTPHSPLTVVFQGDSITEGTGATRPWRGWSRQASYRLGIDNPIDVAVGSSGYLAALNPGHGGGAGDFTFRGRLNDVLKAVDGGPPDAVFIAGGINDNGQSPDAVGAEALLYFQQLRAGAPDMPIFVVTPFTDYNNPGGIAVVNVLRDAIAAAAAKVPGTYLIDVTPLVTPDNRDMIFDGTKNGPHPTDMGHFIYGQFIADAAAKIIQGF